MTFRFCFETIKKAYTLKEYQLCYAALSFCIHPFSFILVRDNNN